MYKILIACIVLFVFQNINALGTSPDNFMQVNIISEKTPGHDSDILWVWEFKSFLATVGNDTIILLAEKLNTPGQKNYCRIRTGCSYQLRICFQPYLTAQYTREQKRGYSLGINRKAAISYYHLYETNQYDVIKKRIDNSDDEFWNSTHNEENGFGGYLSDLDRNIYDTSSIDYIASEVLNSLPEYGLFKYMPGKILFYFSPDTDGIYVDKDLLIECDENIEKMR